MAQPRFWWFVLFRLANGALTHTYGYPDEYWQAQEVAHRSAFGYGYLTWEWRERIRSILHPWCFAVAYQLVACLGLGDTELVASTAGRWLRALCAPPTTH